MQVRHNSPFTWVACPASTGPEAGPGAMPQLLGSRGLPISHVRSEQAPNKSYVLGAMPGGSSAAAGTLSKTCVVSKPQINPTL